MVFLKVAYYKIYIFPFLAVTVIPSSQTTDKTHKCFIQIAKSVRNIDVI